MGNIKQAIVAKLQETEKAYAVKIPLAIESGSRGWGFASPDSDYDCRFIYVHPESWYLTVLEKKDVIEYSVDAIYDINGWDIRKVLRHIIKSNAVMFEWLSSNEVYVRDEVVMGMLKGLAEDFFNPIAVSYHYLGIARNKFAEILSEDATKLKRYFYVLRPIVNLNYIRQYGRIPYMEYDRTLADIETPSDVLKTIRELRELKAVSDESFRVKPDARLIGYFQSEIDKFTELLLNMKYDKNRDYEMVDTAFKEIIERVWADES